VNLFRFGSKAKCPFHKECDIEKTWRVRELTGFVAFDQTHHYEIELPEGWRNWDDVKKKD
jgi:hypothetical protein